jgi:hypothetical protein
VHTTKSIDTYLKTDPISRICISHYGYSELTVLLSHNLETGEMRPLPLLTLTTDDETSIMQQTSPLKLAGTSSSLDQEI